MGTLEWIILCGVGVGLIWIIVMAITSPPKPPKPPEFEDEQEDD